MNFKSKIKRESKSKLKNYATSFLEKKVVFSFRYIMLHNRFCFSKTKDIKKDLEGLYCSFKDIEKLTWKQFYDKSRKKGGLNPEKRKSKNYKMLSRKCPELDSFGHFYLNNCSSGVGRIFGGFKNGFFYIVFVDINGKINGESHK